MVSLALQGGTRGVQSLRARRYPDCFLDFPEHT